MSPRASQPQPCPVHPPRAFGSRQLQSEGIANYRFIHRQPKMSTIASPREPPRRTPTSSTRPSFETTRSAIASPVLGQAPAFTPQPRKTSSNRAALREYYNLRAQAPRIEIPDSEVPASELDGPDFDPEEHVSKVVAGSSLEELLRLYTRVVGEVRALDAEKKALVYDNYSKLITATETIRKAHLPVAIAILQAC